MIYRSCSIVHESSVWLLAAKLQLFWQTTKKNTKYLVFPSRNAHHFTPLQINEKFWQKLYAQCRLKASNTQKFCARKLLAENKRNLSGFAKYLFYRMLCAFWPKNRLDAAKKSTPNFQKSLTFSSAACFRKRKRWQKTAKFLHKTAIGVQDFAPKALFRHRRTLHKRAKMCNFSLQNENFFCKNFLLFSGAKCL